jgi:glycosyltransferase involved in cell wall biosynthesis
MSAQVAVITPLFGHAEYLGDMLESLLSQDFVDWECCVCIDGPDKQAKQVARSYAESDPRITWVMTHERRGVSAARNLAVKNTTAPLLLPFDADDMMEPGYIETLVRSCDGVVTGKYPVAYAAARCLRPNHSVSVFQYPEFNRSQFTEYFQVPNSSMHPRALWEELGGWDEAWMTGAEDWHYWARGVAADLITPVNCKSPLWAYREHEGIRNSRVGKQFWPQHKQKIDAILRGSHAT